MWEKDGLQHQRRLMNAYFEGKSYLCWPWRLSQIISALTGSEVLRNWRQDRCTGTSRAGSSCSQPEIFKKKFPLHFDQKILIWNSGLKQWLSCALMIFLGACRCFTVRFLGHFIYTAFMFFQCQPLCVSSNERSLISHSPWKKVSWNMYRTVRGNHQAVH